MGAQDIGSTKQALINKLNNLPVLEGRAALIDRVNDAGEKIDNIRKPTSRFNHRLDGVSANIPVGGNGKPHNRGSGGLDKPVDPSPSDTGFRPK